MRGEWTCSRLPGFKLYAPKGVGALCVREGMALEPRMPGARQGSGRRPQTQNVLEVVGLGKACQIALRDLTVNSDHTQRMRDGLDVGLRERVPRLRVNRHPDKRLPNTLSISVQGVDANALLGAIEVRVAASAGAACHSGQIRVSHVLRAMHVPEEWARGTLAVERLRGERT